jgi:aryl-alcohol dehydrogenase-like predicted oxidoreductase
VWDDSVPLEETLRTLDDFVRCGKVRYVGASNVTGWQMQKIVDLGRQMGLNPFIALQVS